MSIHDPTRRPPDYFARREQYRLLMLVFSLMLVLVLMFEAAKPSRWEWMWQLSDARQDQTTREDPSLDTRVPPSQVTTPADVFLSPARRVAHSSMENVHGMLPAVADMDLSELRDNTVLRGVERPAWNGLLSVLQQTDPVTLAASSSGPVGFTQLFRQPDAYRGRTVTVAGTIRRAFLLPAVANEIGVERYWQCWLFPDGSLNPIVVYSLEMPAGFPEGMSLREHVEFVGIFYKRWAYAAQRDTRTAPLVLAQRPTWQPSPAVSVDRPITSAEITQVVLFAVLAAMVITWLIFLRTRLRQDAPAVQVGSPDAGPHDSKIQPMALLWLSLFWLTAQTHPATAQHVIAPPAKTKSVQQYLDLFELGPSQLAAAANVVLTPGTSSEADHQRALGIFQCLRRCPVAVLSSLALGADEWLNLASPSAAGQVVRLRGQLTSLSRVELPAELRQRTGRDHYFLCTARVGSELSRTVQILADEVPKRWASGGIENVVHERISCWAMLLRNDLEQPGETHPTGTSAARPVLATRRIAWHPDSVSQALRVQPNHVLLANYGLDVGQLDEVQLRGRLSSEDRAAFYQMLLAVGRIEDAVLRDAARSVNVTELLQNTETHCGQLYEVAGTARRCVRVLVDDAEVQSEYGISSYFELVVFLDPDAIVKVRNDSEDAGQYFATYPVVVCVSRLPEGFPQGEDIHAGVRVVGAYLKMWAYPSEFMQTSGTTALQFSPLLLGNVPQLIRPTVVSDPLSGLAIPIAFGSVLFFLCGLVWWWNRGDDRFKRATLSRKYDLPSDVVLDEQDFEVTRPDFETEK